MLVSELMSTKVVQASPQTSLKRAIELMLDKDVSGLPVVDDCGRLCGILTEGDILRRTELNLAPKTAPRRYDASFFRSYVETHGRTVGDCMTHHVISVTPQTRLFDLVAMMRAHNVKRLPVLDDGRLVGIVSRRDVLRTVTTARDEIAGGAEALKLAVATRLQSELGFGADRLEVRVRGSVVELVGVMNSESERQAVRAAVEGIAGISAIITSPPLASH